MFCRTSTISLPFFFFAALFLAADFFAVPLPFVLAFFTLTARPPQNLGSAGLQACAQARHFSKRASAHEVPVQTSCAQKHERRAFQRASHSIAFFLNSIKQVYHTA